MAKAIRSTSDADVFALGSIFCELLTGEPAFTGRSSGEIQRKAARGELADAMARLDQNSLGHDPELISLAKSCLAPERDDRPRNAGEVAERMSLYHARVQDRLRQSEIARAEEKARAEEATKRAAVERDRLRLTVALAASILGLMLLGAGGWAYFAQQRAARQSATERVVTAALDKATLLRGQAKAASVGDLSNWPDALAAVNAAKSALDAGESTRILKARVRQLLKTMEQEKADASRRAAELDKDRKFFERLDAIRVASVDKDELAKTDSAFATAFHEFGIDVDLLDPAESGRLFKERSNPQEFASRLDDWALIRRAAVPETDKSSWKRLVLTAQATDVDPWRNSLRALMGEDDHEAARRLASDENQLAKQPARSLYLVAQVLESTRGGDHGRPVFDHEAYLNESIEILKRAWRLSPNDYQICRKLGVEADSQRDRVSFSTAAIAANPQSPHARRALGEALLPPHATEGPSWTGYVSQEGDFFTEHYGTRGGRPNQSPSSYSPPRWRLKTKEGVAIQYGPMWPIDLKDITSENLSSAVAEFCAAVRLAPEDASLHLSLAIALALQERYDEAIREYEHVARIDPKAARFDSGVANYLYLKGELERALKAIRHELERNPHDKIAYMFLGIIYHEQNRKDLAFAAFREAFLISQAQPSKEDIYLVMETGKPDEVVALFLRRSRPIRNASTSRKGWP